MNDRLAKVLADDTRERYAVLTAAGSGTRLGASCPKALVRIGGESLVIRALCGLVQARVSAVVVTAPRDSLSLFQDEVCKYATSLPSHVRVDVIAGGTSRRLSVAAGLDELEKLVRPDPQSVVLIHDAARPLTPPDMIERVASAIEAGDGAAIPAIDVTDTLKEVSSPHEGESEAGMGELYIAGSVNRYRMRAAQTPQGFTWDVISRAHRDAHTDSLSDEDMLSVTDDACLVEAMGIPVRVVPGDQLALKITRALDVSVARVLLEDMQSSS